MTKEDIIAMANEFFSDRLKPAASWAINDVLADFGVLVAEREREECAKVCEYEATRGLPDEQPVGRELKEACLQISTGVFCAAAIRARSEK